MTVSPPVIGGRAASTSSARQPALRILACLVMAVIGTCAVIGWSSQRSLHRGNDVIPLYVAAQDVQSGRVADIYDPGAITTAEHRLAPDLVTEPLMYLNPPALALAAVPLTLVPATGAIWCWALVQALLLIAAVALILGRPARGQRATFAFAATWSLISLPVMLMLVLGQMDGICALALALAVRSWRADRAVVAATAIGVALALGKPQLFLPLVAFAVARDGWRAVRGLASGAGVIALIPLVVFGVGPYAGFLSAALRSATSPSSDTLVGLNGIVDLVTTSPALRVASSGTIAVLAVVAGGYLGRRRELPLLQCLICVAVLGILGSPHALPYDVSLLAPLIASAIASARTQAAWAVAWLAIGIAVTLDFLADIGVGPALHLTTGALSAIAAGLFVARGPREGLPDQRRGDLSPPGAEVLQLGAQPQQRRLVTLTSNGLHPNRQPLMP